MNISEWRIKEELAKSSYKGALLARSGYLIEVSAQHPLEDGMFPGEEYTQRLCLAQKALDDKSFIYLPGSLHIPDKIPLCEAGKIYLLEKGVPEDKLILTDDEIYNSTDECEVASRILEERELITVLCICSPAQVMRKALSYISFGIYPKFIVNSCDAMFHSYIEEATRNVPILLKGGDCLTLEKERLKRERKP